MLCVLLWSASALARSRFLFCFSEGSPHHLRMKITVQKIGGIWHGYLEGHPEVDERALTEEMARVKVERIVERLRQEGVK